MVGDGQDDCEDASDEESFSANEGSCSSDQFRCLSSGICIPYTKLTRTIVYAYKSAL